MLFLGDVFSELVVISMFLQLAVMDFSSFTLSNFPSCSCEYNIHYWPLYEEPDSQICLDQDLYSSLDGVPFFSLEKIVND